MAIQTVKTGAAVNDGTGDDARTAFTKINQNFTDSANAASRLVGTDNTNLVEAKSIGFAALKAKPMLVNNSISLDHLSAGDIVFCDTGAGLPANSPKFGYSTVFTKNLDIYSTTARVQITYDYFSTEMGLRHYNAVTKIWSDWVYYYTTANTTKDPNGFIKAASPIVSIYADKIELNSEAKLQDITFEKLGVGDYLIKGSSGFAQEGWYIETPKDANGNVLVAVVYEQLANNDISVKTYDYMLNKKGRIVPDLETPLDIPATRWIDLRLQALPPTNPLSNDETVTTNAE